MSIDEKQYATKAVPYLGLIQEKVADEKDRNVILTALLYVEPALFELEIASRVVEGF